eukprot:scaffold5150_cov376-Prasinococcus_capsulatus_cf.AAC.13
MFIKQVVIEGFKSYKEQVATEEFSSKHNTIVGPNGSGKSNFFQAIQFVLSDSYQNLRVEDRQALLHEGAGQRVLTAFVELVFDNSDGRLPVDSDEVRLRRTIGLKKDEYFLDRKRITRNELLNLLESAGFSRSNPYYIVQQGKIAALTVMKDKDRLELLKDIGGTRVYEERRKESLKIMQETESRQKEIGETITFIEGRLKELDEEKEELQNYQQADKKRRSVQYTIYDKELSEARSKLAEVEDERQHESTKTNSLYNTLQDLQDGLTDAEKDVKAAQQKLDKFQKGKIREDLDEVVKSKTKLELDIQDLRQSLTAEEKISADTTAALRLLQDEIAGHTTVLSNLRAQLSQESDLERQMQLQISDKKHRLDMLYQKQGRSSQFSSKKERDDWLKQEISELESNLEKQVEALHNHEQEEAALTKRIAEADSNIKKMSEDVGELQATIEKCSTMAKSAKHERDALMNERKDLWKKDMDLENELEATKKEAQMRERQLEQAVPRDINRGLRSVRKICEDHDIQGVYGTLLELLECDDRFNTAVEVTAGNALFQLVVDSDETASRIVGHLNRQKGGRVTFMPLNRLQVRKEDYPKGNDVMPLLSKLRYNKQFEPAFHQVFGKTIICKDLDVATRVARESKFNCITLDGDQVNKRGALTGGYQDHRRSRIAAIASLQELGASQKDLEKELEMAKDKMMEVDQKVTLKSTDMSKLEDQRQHSKSRLDQLKLEIRTEKETLARSKKNLDQKKRASNTLQLGIAETKRSIEELKQEKGTDLLAQLTDAEKKELSQLNPEVSSAQEQLYECESRKMQLETKVQQLETQLESNFYKRKGDLEATLGSLDTEQKSTTLADMERQLNTLVSEGDDALKQKMAEDEEIDRLRKTIREAKSEQEEKRAGILDLQRALQDGAKKMDGLFNKKAILAQRREDLMRKIRDLGSLPAEAFETYKDMSMKQLQGELKRSTDDLKAYAHVNKKALDQYVSFFEQREELVRRQAELTQGEGKIKELIQVLDQRKQDAIQRTFRMVGKNFEEIFKELVPGGKGELVMQRIPDGPKDADDEGDEEEEEGERDPSDRYGSVKVKVSFGQTETQSMKQLSGGQKTVVALALIFAIQRCDPAPFYLFDEIDAALDPQYRTAVGAMIKRLASSNNQPTQFITTTFRPELVKCCDKLYGVTHSNRVSRVDVITEELGK